MDYDEIYDNDDFFNEPTEDEYVRDEVIDEAKEEIVAFFNQKKKDVLYLRQIQIKFEKKYFHWITEKAVNEPNNYSCCRRAG